MHWWCGSFPSDAEPMGLRAVALRLRAPTLALHSDSLLRGRLVALLWPCLDDVQQRNLDQRAALLVLLILRQPTATTEHLPCGLAGQPKTLQGLQGNAAGPVLRKGVQHPSRCSRRHRACSRAHTCRWCQLM